jgi:hypothetical protein
MKHPIEGLGMDTNTPSTPNQEESLRTLCPFCLSETDAHLDIKKRPYWRCWRCEVRSFGTKTALKALKEDGWIWTNERPLEALRTWLNRVGRAVGLTKKGK